MPRDRQERVSAARRRAEEHQSGYSTTVLHMPEGLSFYDWKVGIHEFDVVPWIVKRGKREPGGNPFADTGELYFERTFWQYRSVGPEEKAYVCPSKTFGKPDYIQEYRQKQARDPNADPDALKALDPKERQIFLLHNRLDSKGGLELLEQSYHLFGKLLDSRVKNSREGDGWDFFYYPDETGFTLRVTVEESSSGKYKFNEATAIDFLPRRKGLPDAIVNHGYNPDSMLVDTPYDRLKAIFMGVPEEGGDRGGDRPADRREERRDTTNTRVSDDDGRRTTEPARREEPPFQDKPKNPAKNAEDYGLAKDDLVDFEGGTFRILRIEKDGYFVTLLNDDTDEVRKGVSVADVRKHVETKRTTEPDRDPPRREEPPRREPEREPAAAGGGTDEGKWDSDWND